MFQFTTEQWLPVNMYEAWDFFSSPKNLSKITPPELDFRILTNLNGEEIYEGMVIDYTVKPLFGIPLHWQSEITGVEKYAFFSDIQTKGPYKLWKHTHYFESKDGGILMKDVVDYNLYFGFLGKAAEKIIVRKKIEKIFEYRKAVLEKLFLKK